MSDICRITISGRVTRDPELRLLPSGTEVLDLGLAWNTGRKVNGEWVEDSNFIDATAFGRRAEFLASKLQKGSLVFVEGRLRYESWEAQDGSKRSKHKVYIDELKSPDLFKTGGATMRGETSPATESFVPAAADDDIPF